MITIAGSGPSANGYTKSVDVATKKRPLPSEYVACRFGFSARNTIDGVPLMLFYRRGFEPENWIGPKPCWYADSDFWLKYYKQFIRSKSPPQKTKPSSGCCAVMMVMQRWAPEQIGLIGFDNILDGNPEWEHDAIAERECILSLTEIIDLRTGDVLNKEKGCSHFTSDSTPAKPLSITASSSQS